MIDFDKELKGGDYYVEVPHSTILHDNILTGLICMIVGILIGFLAAAMP